MERREYLAGAALTVITAATLWSSLEYQESLAREYGNIVILLFPTAAVISFIMGLIISIFFQWGISIVHFEKIVRLLPKDEATILTLLFNKQRVTQTEIFAITSISRAKISRILSRLEDRGVIIKRPWDDTNLIEAKLYGNQPSTQLLTRLPGFSETRLIIVLSLVLLFGVMLAMISDIHILTLQNPFKPVMYLSIIELVALGALFSIILRRRIVAVQLEKTLDILPEDERETLRVIYSKQVTTQKQIIEETGIYQMKVSRILKKIEQKGLIKRKPYGYTNIVISQI